MEPYKENREQPRNKGRMPSDIECITGRTGDHFHATIWDVSRDGLYIETEYELTKGEDISIHTEQHESEGLTGTVNIDNTTGIVRWLRTMEQGGHRLYGAGVVFSYLDLHDESCEGKRSMNAPCDLCGVSAGVTRAMHHLGLIWLCPKCNEQMNHLPEKLDEIMEEFLIGNAL